MPNQRDLFGLDVSAPEDGSGASRSRRPRAGSPSGVASPAFTPGSAVLTRLVDTSVEIARAPPSAITYQHTVLCQIGMPYRNQGMSRLWERCNGRVHLRIEAGSALHPVQAQFVSLPLPFGPKARLILIHLNGEALRRGSPTIEVEDSLTAFVKRLVGRSPNGRRDPTLSRSARLAVRFSRPPRRHRGREGAADRHQGDFGFRLVGAARSAPACALGRPSFSSVRTISRVLPGTRFRSTSALSLLSRILPSRSMSMPGLPSGCIVCPLGAPSACPGRCYASSSVPAMAGSEVS